MAMTSKEITYLYPYKKFSTRNTTFSLSLSGFQREDGKFISLVTNGPSIKKGDCFSEDEVKVKNLIEMKIKRVIVNNSNSGVPDADKNEDVNRVKRIQPFIGCRVWGYPTHYASGKRVYLVIHLDEYVSEEEVEILS